MITEYLSYTLTCISTGAVACIYTKVTTCMYVLQCSTVFQCFKILEKTNYKKKKMKAILICSPKILKLYIITENIYADTIYLH